MRNFFDLERFLRGRFGTTTDRRPPIPVLTRAPPRSPPSSEACDRIPLISYGLPRQVSQSVNHEFSPMLGPFADSPSPPWPQITCAHYGPCLEYGHPRPWRSRHRGRWRRRGRSDSRRDNRHRRECGQTSGGRTRNSRRKSSRRRHSQRDRGRNGRGQHSRGRHTSGDKGEG